MTFTGNEDHNIDLDTASEWTANYRATLTSTSETIGEFFGKEYIQSILSQNDCVGLRAYYALDGNGKKHLILCGVKSNGDDIYDGILAEFARKSPPYSSNLNPLNS